MNDAVVGAMVGGLIALAGTALASAFVHFRWKRDLDLAYYREERGRLEKDFEELLELYVEGLKEGTINATMAAKFEIASPDIVREEFQRAVAEKIFSNDDVKEKQRATFSMAYTMQRALREYDEKILGANKLFSQQRVDSIRESITRLLNSGIVRW